MVDPDSLEYAQWVLLFALGGHFGNFVFSLTDHAANGFFYPLEWVPVGASALAVGFLFVPHPCVSPVSGFVRGPAPRGRRHRRWGFFLHGERNLHGPLSHMFNNLIYGAAPIAPLLFPNLMVLGLIAIWRLHTIEDRSPAPARAL